VDLRGANAETWRELFAHPERFIGEPVRHYLRIDYDEDGQPNGRLLVYEPPLPPPVRFWSRLGSLWAQFRAWLRGMR
jgi:hypothetical protein